MLGLPVVLLAALPSASPLVLHVEVADNLTDSDTAELTRHLSKAVARRTSREVRVDPAEPSGPCDAECQRSVTERTGAPDLVLLRFYGAITSIGVFVSRAPGTSEPLRVDVDRDPASWPEVFGSIAASLFPSKSPPLAERAPSPPSPSRGRAPDPAPARARPAASVALSQGIVDEPPSRSGPYLLAGAGAVLAAAGAALTVSWSVSLDDVEGRLAARDDRGRIEGIGHQEALDAYASINLRQGLSFAALGAGAAALGGAVIWWALSPEEPSVAPARPGSAEGGPLARGTGWRLLPASASGAAALVLSASF